MEDHHFHPFYINDLEKKEHFHQLSIMSIAMLDYRRDPKGSVEHKLTRSESPPLPVKSLLAAIDMPLSMAHLLRYTKLHPVSGLLPTPERTWLDLSKEVESSISKPGDLIDWSKPEYFHAMFKSI